MQNVRSPVLPLSKRNDSAENEDKIKYLTETKNVSVLLCKNPKSNFATVKKVSNCPLGAIASSKNCTKSIFPGSFKSLQLKI